MTDRGELDQKKIEKLYEIYTEIEKKCGDNLITLLNWMLFAKDWAEKNDALNEYNAILGCISKAMEEAESQSKEGIC